MLEFLCKFGVEGCNNEGVIGTFVELVEDDPKEGRIGEMLVDGLTNITFLTDR